MSERIRSFIAIVLDTAVRELVASEIDRLRPLARSVTWVAPQNLHLTLKFLGDIDAAAVEAAKEGLAEGVSEAGPFTLTLHGVGAFPGLARPRVIWIGVAGGACECQALQARVEEALGRRGLPKEGRAYTPHLTIGRVRQPRGLAQLQQAIAQDAHKGFGELSVSSIALMRSDLDPAGARYTELYPVPFPDR